VTSKANEGKELQCGGIRGIRHFMMVNKESEKIAMALKELSLHLLCDLLDYCANT
jgi:hypothetical protein